MLALDTNASSIDVTEFSVGDVTAVHVLAVTVEGAVAVWNVPITAKGKAKPLAPHGLLDFASPAPAAEGAKSAKSAKTAAAQTAGGATPVPVIRAKFVGIPIGILVARGNLVRPVFEHIVRPFAGFFCC
mgnify:CR=1 FL=1